MSGQGNAEAAAAPEASSAPPPPVPAAADADAAADAADAADAAPAGVDGLCDDMSPAQREAVLQQNLVRSCAKAQKLEEENTKLRIQLRRISGGTDVAEMESLGELKRTKANTEAKLVELQVRLDGKAAQMSTLEKELAALAERNRKLADENCTYLQESRDRAASAGDVLSERDALKLSVSELELRLRNETDAAEKVKGYNRTLQENLARAESERGLAVATLRAERDAALADAAAYKKLHDEVSLKHKQSVADLELREDEKVAEMRSLKDARATEADARAMAEQKLAALEAQRALEAEKRLAAEEHLESLQTRVRKVTDETSARVAAAQAEAEESRTARNAAENECVTLRAKLNSIHPLLRAEGEDAEAEGGDGGGSVPLPFSFSEIIKLTEQYENVKARLASLQALHAQVEAEKLRSSDAVAQEQANAQRLAAELIELRADRTAVAKERDAAVAWRKKNELAVSQARDALRSNDLLSQQLSYLVHETQRVADGGDVAASAASLPVEFGSVKELQQKNIELNCKVAALERVKDEALARSAGDLERVFEARLAEVERRAAAVSSEKEAMAEALRASTEKCRSLAESLEVCGTRRLEALLPSGDAAAAAPSAAAAAAPAAAAGALSWGDESSPDLGAPAGGSGGLAALAEPGSLAQASDELNATREELEKVQYELLECRRERDTVGANLSHLNALLESAHDGEVQLKTERDHHRERATEAEKAADEMLQKLMETEAGAAAVRVRAATLELELGTCRSELDRLRSTHACISDSDGKLQEVLLQVEGVKGFVQRQRESGEAKLRTQRDEARQSLAKKEEALQAVNTQARIEREQHEQDLTDLRAQLATCQDKLASVTKMLDNEKDLYKSQIIANKKLSADLERAESERRILKQADTGDETNYLASANNTVRDLQRQIEERDSRLGAQGAAMAGYKQAMQQLEAAAAQAQARLKESEGEVATLHGKVAAVAEKEQRLEAAAAAKMEELTGREAAVQRREAEQREAIEGLQSANQSLQDELRSGESGRVDALRRRDEAVAEAEKIKGRYEDAVIGNADLTKQLQELRAASAAAGGAAPLSMFGAAGGGGGGGGGDEARGGEAARKEAESLRAELDTAHALLAALEPAQEIGEAEATAVLDCMRGRNKELQQRFKTAQGDIRVLQAQVEQLRRQAELAAKLSSRADVSAKLERRIETLKEDIKERAQREATLTEELGVLRAEKEAIATAPDYEAIVKNLTEDKAELEAKVKQLGVKANESLKLRENLNTKHQELASSKQEVKNLAASLAQTETSLAAADEKRKEAVTKSNSLVQLLKKKKEEILQLREENSQAKEKLRASEAAAAAAAAAAATAAAAAAATSSSASPSAGSDVAQPDAPSNAGAKAAAAPAAPPASVEPEETPAVAAAAPAVPAVPAFAAQQPPFSTPAAPSLPATTLAGVAQPFTTPQVSQATPQPSGGIKRSVSLTESTEGVSEYPSKLRKLVPPVPAAAAFGEEASVAAGTATLPPAQAAYTVPPSQLKPVMLRTFSDAAAPPAATAAPAVAPAMDAFKAMPAAPAPVAAELPSSLSMSGFAALEESKKQKDNPFLKKDKDVIAKTSWS